MIGALHITRSGLLHGQRRLDASAHNTANLATDETSMLRSIGFTQPSRQGVMSQTAATGISRSRGGAPPPGILNQRAGPFVAEAVEQVTIRHQSGALLRVARTQDDMLRLLVDLRA